MRVMERSFSSFLVLLISIQNVKHIEAHLSSYGKDRFQPTHHDFDSYIENDIWGRKDLLRKDNSLKEDAEDDAKYLRLPLEVIPFHYFLELIPILENNTGLGEVWSAPGNVKILVKAVKAGKTVTMHALNLNISNVQMVNRKTGGNVTVANHTYHKYQDDQYVINLEEILVEGDNYEISLDFVAPISRRYPDGLYRSQFFDPITENITYLVSTQFEFFHARQVFPCFDEPALKTPFDIAIGRSSRFHSLSNSNKVSSVPILGKSDWFIDTYNTTVKMPTYLVALVVSNYTFSEADPKFFKDKPVRVYGPKYLIEKGAGDFGVNVSAKVLSFFENYFGIEYPMQKMDSVSVPGFLHGAMENYGLNIYRESFLLNIPGVTTEKQRGRLSSVIAHESAHQYFGNLVTCKFWDNIWLNEGFATYFAAIANNATNPEYDSIKQFLLEGPQYAFSLDSRERTSYPLLLTAKTKNEYEHQAVRLPYYKGASLIRMMSGFLTPGTFHRGIKRYLRTWAHQAVEQDDLFQSLTEEAHEDGTLELNMTVKQIMDPWTKQRGYPLVRVISSDDDTLYILYEKFKSQNIATNNEQHVWWPIPISYVTQDNPDFQNHVPKFWIPEGSVVRKMKHDTKKWIIVNHETTAFYRVVYDKKLTSLLQQQFSADHTAISAFARSQILDDYFTLGDQMDIPISMALNFTKHFGSETEEICWSVFLKHIRRLYYFYSETESRIGEIKTHSPKELFRGFRNYIIPRMEEVLEKIGFEQEPHEIGAIVIFRARLLNWACRFGSKKCLSYANRLFETWKAEPNQNNPIPLDIRDIMYCHGVAAGGLENWIFLVEQSNEETQPGESLLQIKSLGCVKDESILKLMLNSLVRNGGFIESKGADVLFDAVAENPIGRPILMQFLNKNIPKMKKAFGATFNSMINKIFVRLGTFSHTEEVMLEMQNIVENHSDTLGDLTPVLSSYADEVEDNIMWISEKYEPMKIWFESQI